MKPTLVIMAAGLGSRYGGLKQLDKIGPNGEMILEISAFDAIRAGFGKLVFILRKEILDEFKELIGKRLEQFIDVKYVIQNIYDLPEGFTVPKERTKPWGTGQAVLATKNVIDGPFAVINADDFYGTESFKLLCEFLKNNKDENNSAMIGYRLNKTLSENGHVARGICEVENNKLKDIVEIVKIIKKGDAAFYTEDDENFIELDYNGIVSMNMWGFMPSIFEQIENQFIEFLETTAKENPLKSEFYIPSIVGKSLKEKRIQVDVIPTIEKWYGVTYKNDKEDVKKAIEEMIIEGRYSKNLWEDLR